MLRDCLRVAVALVVMGTCGACADDMTDDAGGGAGSGGGGGKGTGGGSGSGGGTTGFASNTPGATVVDVGSPATPSLVLVSSNVQQEPSGGQTFQRWLGEVKNNGTTKVCQVQIAVNLVAASGTRVASFSTFLDAEPYLYPTIDLVIPCLAPGQVGGVYDNGFVATAAQLSTVSRIEVSFDVPDPSGYTNVVPEPHAPLITSHVTTAFGSELAVAGTLTGVGGAIYAIGIDVYPRDAAGLVVDHLIDTDLDTLFPGGQFSMMTTSTPSSFSVYRVFTDFLEGTRSGAQARRGDRALSPAESSVAEADAARRAERDAARERDEQFRAAAGR